jgi:hypothetical protein
MKALPCSFCKGHISINSEPSLDHIHESLTRDKDSAIVHWLLQRLIYNLPEPGSSVSIVSGCGLDDWAIEIRSPAEARDFSSSLCVQTGSGAHPASCAMGIGGPFPGGKARPGPDADHSPPSSPEV